MYPPLHPSPRHLLTTTLVGALALCTLWTSDVGALESCKAKVAKDGAILVSAKDVSGVLEWGNALGQEVNAFGNAATCLAGGGASKCELGTGAQRITPPELCTVFLADGAGTCSAFLKGCTPGLRTVGSGFVSKSGDVVSGTLRALTLDTGFGVPGCGAGDVCAQSRLITQFGGAQIGGDLELGDGIRQGSSHGGVVKAGLLVHCDATFASITRFFNTTGSGGSFSVVGAGFGNDGECTLTTPFPISTRYFSATGMGGGKVLVTVDLLGTNALKIRRTQESLGVFGGADGDVSLVIY